MSLEATKGRILSNNNFLIACHYNPDADTIGAALALYQGLRQLQKTCAVLSKDGIPKDCNFLPFINVAVDFSGLDMLPFTPEHLIIVDCNSPKRVSQERNHQERLSLLPTIVIDHHEINGSYGDIQWIEPDTASTTMLVNRLLKALNVEINKDIALCLYAGLCIDTGNFRHDNTTSEALRVAAELVKVGISPTRVYRALFESWSSEKFRLFKETLQGLEERDGIAIMTVTREMLARHGCSDEDAGNFVDFPKRSVYIKVSVMLREVSEGKYRISMRSKGDVNVAQVAVLYGGGGHKNAAGCTIEGEPLIIKKELFSRLSEAISQAG